MVPTTGISHEGTRERARLARGILGCLGASALALALAPTLMPTSYSWLSQTTSESAAQSLQGAWMARLGFLLFGLAVFWLSATTETRWGRWGSKFNGAFGVLMVAAAVFSHRPFATGVPFDPIEDLLHSLAATLMGFAFALGVVAVSLRRADPRPRSRALDVLAVIASVVIPLAMTMSDGYAGLLQRVMFLVAYIWYANESLRTLRIPTTAKTESGPATPWRSREAHERPARGAARSRRSPGSRWHREPDSDRSSRRQVDHR